MSKAVLSVPRRTLASAVVVAATLLLVGWWSGQALADHDEDEVIHVCVEPSGALRVAEECAGRRTSVHLATEAGLRSAQVDTSGLESRLAALESTVGDQATTIAALQSEVAGLRSANDDLTGQVGALRAANEDLTGQVLALRAADADLIEQAADAGDRIHALETLLAGVTRQDVAGRDTLRLSGMNLQVVDGTGTTDGQPNGLGNVIVGYDAASPEGSDKSGSHYLVVGDEHTYSRFGGIVAGLENAATGDWASVTGGSWNTASGRAASVTGGGQNEATGPNASVSGGLINRATETGAAVLGGVNNAASGWYAVVAGGWGNQATGTYASVAGGDDNTASAIYASVSGGTGNTASGIYSSVLGGRERTAATAAACHPGCS